MRTSSATASCSWWLSIRQLLIVVSFFSGSASADGPDLPARGQTVYVPIYSEIRHGNLDSSGAPDSAMMSILVSIRNTDPTNSIQINRALYYDTAGKMIRDYAPKPIRVNPFGTAELFVELRESAGGSGANFAIDWEGTKPVSPPIIEALHSRFQAGYSMSFISRGKAISTR